MVEPGEGDGPLPEQHRRGSSTRNIVIFVAVAAALALFVTQVLPLLIVLWPRSQKPAGRLDDTNNLRNIAGLIVSTKDLPLAPDGRIDVYEILRRDVADTGLIVKVCRSARVDKGPTWEEIEAHDYTNFPYQRHRGALDRKSLVRVPVVWDRKPEDWGSDRGEGRLAAFSDGSAMFQEEAAFGEFFHANPGQE